MNPKLAARISPAFALFLGSVAAALILVVVLARKPADPAAVAGAPAREPLLVYCAAGIKAPIEAVAREFEQSEGVKVQLNYGGSQTLLANLAVSARGDLYIAAEDAYVQMAREKNLVREIIPLAQMRVALAVARGNPKKITTLADLLKTDVRLAQANPDAAAVGKLTREALQKTGEWEPLRAHTIVFKPTVNDVANDLKLGSVDAGFVWDATIRQYPELEAVPVAALTNLIAHVSAGVLTSSKQPTAALRFARFLAARDRGQKQFEQHGFTPVNGEPFAQRGGLRARRVWRAGFQPAQGVVSTVAVEIAAGLGAKKTTLIFERLPTGFAPAFFQRPEPAGSRRSGDIAARGGRA